MKQALQKRVVCFCMLIAKVIVNIGNYDISCASINVLALKNLRF